MADPLGLMGGAAGGGPGGLQGLGARGLRPGLGQPGGGGQASNAQEGPSFKDSLIQSLNQVNKLQEEATAKTENMLTGQGTVEDALLATAKADAAFRMLMALRNKVQAAYDEVKQIRV